MNAILILCLFMFGCNKISYTKEAAAIEIDNNNNLSILSLSSIKWEDDISNSGVGLEKNLVNQIMSKTASMIAMNGFGPNLIIKFSEINLMEFRNSVIACDAKIAISQDENDIVLNIKAKGRQDIVNHNTMLAIDQISLKLAKIIRDTLVKHFQNSQSVTVPAPTIVKKKPLTIEVSK